MEIFTRFKEKYSSAIGSVKVSEEIINKYTDILPNELIELWKSHGFGGYENGLLWTINPDEYSGQILDWFNVDIAYVVFARTALGDLFILEDEYNGERTVMHLDVRHADTSTIANSVMALFRKFLDRDYFLKRTKSKAFGKAVTKFGEVMADECYGYEPALVLGGSESLKNLNKVKIIPHLSILAQAGGPLEYT